MLADLGRKVTLGRTGDISLDTPSPEIAHVVGRRSDEGIEAVIRPLDQEHPIQIGGEVVLDSRTLKHGDEIRIGKNVLEYHFFDDSLPHLDLEM